MREIKFRAWDNRKKFMLDWLNIQTDSTHLGHNFEMIDFENVQYTWMQFTGLLDKNGKEIYEGDIVKLERHLSNNGLTSFTNEVVEWRGLQLFPFCLDHKTSFEIIGNIYEHPHLLNK